ncbi:MFS transporter [Kribbella deserti]|uniref:MFS transporter n=1 Tax=Kribbella deserti TaxID=1926257 RepID=A0ABV6QG30_9ACTN
MTATRSRWPVIAAFALVSAATQVLWLNFAGVTTVAAGHYAVSETAIGWLAQVFPLLYIVLSIPAGLILDRWFRAGLGTGAVLTALGAIIRLGGDGYGWLLAGQLVVAVAQPLVLNAITGISGRYLPEQDRPTGIAVGTASTFAGMVIAFVLSAILPRGDQLQLLLILSAAFAVVAAVILLVALRNEGEHRGSIVRGALRTTWNDRFIRKLCLLVVFPFGVFVALTTFSQALLEPSGVSGGVASTILLLNVVAGVIGCAVIPILVVRHRVEVRLLTTALVLTAVGCLVLAVIPGTVSGFVALAAIGFLLLPSLPIVLELVERRTGEAEGTAAGLIWLAGNAGGLLVAILTGLLVHHPFTAFITLAAVALIAVPGAWSLRPAVAAMRPPVPVDT